MEVLVMTVFPILYNLDSKGKIRIWQMEAKGDQYRTISGIEDGKLIRSGWSTAEPKNVGKKNATTGPEQALLEVQYEYQKKRNRKYYDDHDAALKAAPGGKKFFAPMLAQKYDGWAKIRRTNEWIYSQPKLDGVRCIVTPDGAFSREGKPFPAVSFISSLLPFSTTVTCYDGEMYNHDLRDNFNEIISLVKKQKPTDADILKVKQHIQYHIYDVPMADTPFARRYGNLLYIEPHPMIRLVETVEVQSEETLDWYYGDYMEKGYEGQMIRVDANYEHKRSYTLLKRKEFVDEEFKIVRIESGDGNWAGYAKRVIYQLEDGREFGSGLRGNQAFTKELLEKKPWPTLGTCRYQNRTPDGIPRFPVTTRFYYGDRDD